MPEEKKEPNRLEKVRTGGRNFAKGWIGAGLAIVAGVWGWNKVSEKMDKNHLMETSAPSGSIRTQNTADMHADVQKFAKNDQLSNAIVDQWSKLNKTPDDTGYVSFVINNDTGSGPKVVHGSLNASLGTHSEGRLCYEDEKGKPQMFAEGRGGVMIPMTLTTSMAPDCDSAINQPHVVSRVNLAPSGPKAGG